MADTAEQIDSRELRALKNAALRIEISVRLERLETALHQLGEDIIEDRGRTAWAYPAVDGDEARAQLTENLKRLDHEDADVRRALSPAAQDALPQDGRVTVLATGLLACTPGTLASAETVNRYKQAFERGLRVMDERRVRDIDTQAEHNHWVGQSLLRMHLALMGRSRLSRRQATRKLQIETRTPVQASFLWANLPRRYRTTVAELHDKLAQRRDCNDRVNADVERLSELMTNNLAPDTPVVIEKEPHIHPRCNLTFMVEDGDGNTVRENRTRRAIMPILYPDNPDNPEQLVLRRALRAYEPPKRERAQRNDTLIRTPLGLSTCNAYRCSPRLNADASV